ncbi:hypothetical protein [Salinisphaera sp.]|uniref:hypothetical protein n=1 Tax=Salinisphaera sp. TaxID=1914330 RepID=UPI002D794C5F|nr:hypothetical protein [Salinisphaera sp.]HET7313340.1 hypothetical protein [Salinisphaera sp.]
MRNPTCFFVSAATGATLAVSGCASRPDPQLDPIFNAVPGGRYACANAGDDRNPLARGLTSPIGQAVVGGALGGLIGNQFGSHAGRDVATGAGAAAGVAAGAWNARRMADNRYRQCLQHESSRY